MKLDLEGKTAIVTGAARGIGRAIALGFARENAHVVAADLDFQGAARLIEEIKELCGDGLALKADVARNADLEKLVSKTIRRYGRIEILVNNAGICPRTPFEEIPEKEWDRVLAVNLKGIFLLSQKVFSHMKKNRYGKIVNIASGAGKVGGVQVGAHYSASKAGVICLTKTMALAGGPFGINVNAVCPGVIDTEITTSLPRAKIKKYKEMIPLGRIGSADDVANVVLFLASDVSNYITGEIADVNGGLIMD